MINGKKHSWEDITINLPHGTLVDVKDIDYSDKKEVEAIYGKGSNPTGYGEGNYSAEGKITLLRSEFEKINDYAKSQASAFYRLKPFPITVSFADEEGKTKTDELPSCKFTELKQSPKQGDKEMTVELSFVILDPIIRDGLPANDDGTSQ
jgi:hypothetical protein